MLALISAGAVSSLALLSPAHRQIGSENAVAVAGRFVRDYGVQGELKVVSCYRLDRKIAPGGYVWHVSMERAPRTEFSVGVTSEGMLLWFEQSAGGGSQPSKPSPEWKRDALKHANKLLLKLKPKWTVEQPSNDLVDFGEDRFFFPVSINGKRFVGRPIGYTFEFSGSKFDLQRFSQPESVPHVNGAMAKVSEGEATRVFQSTYPSDLDINKTGSRQYRFLGKPQLAYYSSDEEPNTARLVWYVRVWSTYNRGIGVSGSRFGAIVDAMTGEPIKAKNLIS